MNHPGIPSEKLPQLIDSILKTSLLFLFTALSTIADAADLKVMRMGLGEGTVNSTTPGISCGIDCDQFYTASTSVTLNAIAAPGSRFVGWGEETSPGTWSGDCSGTMTTCTIPSMASAKSVRATFEPLTPINTLSGFTPEIIQQYLDDNLDVDTPAEFIAALPPEFKQNWILMSRSESLQTGTARYPRILLPSADARFVFSIGMKTNGNYPGAHPLAIEYMQWDNDKKNFRFHEIVLDDIDAMGEIPARERIVEADDIKCSKCHSTNNVVNNSTFAGTTGLPGYIDNERAKNKPNWDAYDSWGGMLPFNRDRLYQGSIETEAFRKIFNPWTWRNDNEVRSVLNQLSLQPSGVPRTGNVDSIWRTTNGIDDGRVNFFFDSQLPFTVDTIDVAYKFDSLTGPVAEQSPINRGGRYVTLRHSSNTFSSDPTFTAPGAIEGRGVYFFDLMGGLKGNLNQLRVADEIIDHKVATGNFFTDVRPIALAISKGCLDVNSSTNRVTTRTGAALSIDHDFFNNRNGMNINELILDTENRSKSLPMRKADIQKMNLDRTNDIYDVVNENGLIKEYGSSSSVSSAAHLARLRQEVFRRDMDIPRPDQTVMGGIYVDREHYEISYMSGEMEGAIERNAKTVALFRYFLEPLGVSVDKWSMSVRGRSRAYNFADVFSTYIDTLNTELANSISPASTSCSSLISTMETLLADISLPDQNQVPTYTDVQRIFNKSCIECHGGLAYPPYTLTALDLSENEVPTAPDQRLTRAYDNAEGRVTTNPLTSSLYRRITHTNPDCSVGLMPCGGPALSKTDIETIKRWILGGAPFSLGDPHMRTMNGVYYDFQSVGEFVLLRDENSEIQVRQSPVPSAVPLPPDHYSGLQACPSINTAVAVRLGKHKISYQTLVDKEFKPSELTLFIDGKPYQLGANGINLSGGGRIIQTPVAGGIQLEDSGGTKIVVTPLWWDHYQVWYMNVDIQHSRGTQGLMGNIAPNNWLPALPDGYELGAMPYDPVDRYYTLYEKFADAWRVSDDTSLFAYSAGMSTSDFTLDDWPGLSPKTCDLPKPFPGIAPNKPLEPIPLDKAKGLCSNIIDKKLLEFCTHDVHVTGEPGFVKAYIATEVLRSNQLPTIPVLVSPKDGATFDYNKITLSWKTAADKDGDKLQYKYCLWPETRLPNFNDCTLTDTTKVTVYDLEMGNTYHWRLMVEDGKGGTVMSETRRFKLLKK